jgi:hypothetical protein
MKDILSAINQIVPQFRKQQNQHKKYRVSYNV